MAKSTARKSATRKAKAAPAAAGAAPAPARAGIPEAERDRRLGALLAAAVGDAMGLPFAGMYPEEIEDEWGVVTEVELPEGAATAGGGDYTDLMLLTLESLAARGRFDEADTVRRLAAWSGRAKSRNTSTLKAAERLKEGVPPAEAAVTVPTAGAAIRALPLGAAFAGDDPADLEGDVAACAALTHAHPSSVAAAVCLAATVHGLATGRLDPADPAAFLEAVGARAAVYDDELGAKIASLPNLLDLDVDEGLRYVSTSYDATECLPAALYCFAKSPGDLERVLIAAVNAGLATDALGFIAGAIAGAHLGAAAIPERWTRRVGTLERARELSAAALDRR